MAWSRINSFFSRNPRFANTCTGFLAFGCGDILSQELASFTHSGQFTKELDWKRVARTSTLGAVMNGVVLYQWYYVLDLVLGKSMLSGKTILYKMIADQVVYGPLSIAVFFSVSSFQYEPLDWDKSRENFTHKMKSSFLSTYIADCSMWPAVNFVNFRYIPLHLRPTFVGLAQLVWQTYMSSVAFSPDNEPESDGDPVKKPVEHSTHP